MSSEFFAEKLYELGYTDLVSVIPPGAQLVPSSKISQSLLGKIPGRKAKSGLWGGYDWRRHIPSVDDVRQWSIDGANIGLRADYRPAVDIDSTDPVIAGIIETYALDKLGPAPVRTGRAPKRLLMYRTDEPFGRMRLWITAPDGTKHLVEVLGMGQQYLMHGTHPGTGLPYAWDREVPAAHELTTITREQVEAFLTGLGEALEIAGAGVVKREGDGRPITHTAAEDQTSLRAPSLDVLREAVALIPNTSTLFPDRTSYLRMGYAIKAAAGDENDDDGFEVYSEWCARWDDGANDPETVRSDWRRMNGDKAIGWPWIAEQARPFGFNDAALEFDALAPTPEETEAAPITYSDQWLAEQVASALSGVLRYVPETGKFLVYRSNTWQQDGELLAEDLIKMELRKIADVVARQGVTDKEQKEAMKTAMRVCSSGGMESATKFLRSDRSIAVSLSALDHDPWMLNTPAGIVDLKTGKLMPPDPDALCTKATSVPPDFSGALPEFKRFLAEATGGDIELERYLQRLCGYALTGLTREQHLSFIYGEGGTGKSTFLKVLAGILGDYARTADMATFTASRTEKHSTDVAMLVGARLVTASETEAGKRWDESKVKSLTGGDPVTARFLYRDNFTFFPQFKLVFIGNHRPEIRTVDRAMKRRIQMVPFTTVPARADSELDLKLREEWPAILAWMIEGCLAWQAEGLNPPVIVRAATDDYFQNEDAVQRWLNERTEKDEGVLAETRDLYASYRDWARENGEYEMSLKRLSLALVAKGYEKVKHPESRRACVRGLNVINRLGAEFMA